MDFSGELTEAHKEEMEKHAGFNQGHIVEHYDDVAANYEDIYLRAGFPDPRKCADLARNNAKLFNRPISELEVFDMGCGSGLVGSYLYEDGFRNITGCDASPGMLAECERRRPGVHKELVELFLGKPDTFPAHLRNKFDIVTGSGIFADNHLDNKGFDEMLLCLKPGGIACFATRTEYL